MTTSIASLVADQLKDAGIPTERFRAITTHLLAHGCLMRDEDKAEQVLYDEARRIDALIFDYFEVMGMTIHHDLNLQTFRLYPPGASAVGVSMVEETGDGLKGIRQRLSVDFIAAALALRSLYEERMHRGAIDANGEAVCTLEDLSATLSGQLRRALPPTASAKTVLIDELRRHRLIRTNSMFSVQDPDAFIAIRPYVTHLISNEALNAAMERDGAETTAKASASNAPEQEAAA